MIKNEQRLLGIFQNLSEVDQHALLKFAEFLAAGENVEACSVDVGSAEFVMGEPEPTPALENETVVGALKRLSQSYPMLDKSKMLDETSQLMSQHIMQGRDKEEVITELERLFQTRYELMKKKAKPND